MFDEMPPELGQMVEPAALHVSLIDYRSPIEYDKDALDEVNDHMALYLGHVPIEHMVFRPSADRLQKFKRYAGVLLSLTPQIENLRGDLFEIVQRDLDVSLSPIHRLHMSVSRLPQTSSRLYVPGVEPHPTIPAVLHINGAMVGSQFIA
jgi:hypothetical protein